MPALWRELLGTLADALSMLRINSATSVTCANIQTDDAETYVTRKGGSCDSLLLEGRSTLMEVVPPTLRNIRYKITSQAPPPLKTRPIALRCGLQSQSFWALIITRSVTHQPTNSSLPLSSLDSEFPRHAHFFACSDSLAIGGHLPIFLATL